MAVKIRYNSSRQLRIWRIFQNGEVSRIVHSFLTAVGGTFGNRPKFSASRAADVILVIDQGRVVERGSHAELMRERGRYHRLYTEQAL